jgi:tetratricopeptide (TPR) repeat protein
MNITTLMEFLLRSGNLDEASQYEETLKNFVECTDSLASEKAYLPYVRLLIYQNRNEEALRLLENIEINLEKTQKNRELITFYLLYSKACFMGNDNKNSKACFEKAICLAEPQGYYRLFLDEEPIIKDIVCSGIIEDGTFINRIAALMKAPAAQVFCRAARLTTEPNPNR